jgi:hypothetical protein
VTRPETIMKIPPAVRMLLTAALLCLTSFAASGQATTNPPRYTWIATSCAQWNCAAAALVLANGEPSVIVLPTKDTEHPWLILRRVEEGSIFIPDDEPFSCSLYDGMTEATSQYMTLEPCRSGLILNLPDGRAAVASLHTCDKKAKRRAVR